MIPKTFRAQHSCSMRRFLLLTLCLFAWCSSLRAALPNIILMMSDDHGWEETGYNGHPHLKTPVLDEMATKGLKFERFYAAHPSCSPTRQPSHRTTPKPHGNLRAGMVIPPGRNYRRARSCESRISLRTPRQMACGCGQEGITCESAVDGFP